MKATEMENATEQLLRFWQRQKILSSPNTVEDILHFEFSRGIPLPDDFKRMFMIANGMVNLFPNYFDNEGFLFYPLQELTTFEEEFDIYKSGTDEHCIIFAEFMHKSWWYAVKFSKGSDSYEIGIIASVDNFKAITQSLAEFIHLYMNNASILYEYGE